MATITENLTEQKVSLEGTRTELRKAQVMLLIMVGGLVISLINRALFGEPIAYMFSDPMVYNFVLVWMFIFIGYETLLLIRVRAMLKRAIAVPFYIKLLNTFVETSMPGAVFYFICINEEAPFMLDSPVPLILFFIIILSILHLEPWLCLLSGALGAIQYVLLTVMVFQTYNDDVLAQLSFGPNLYYSKSSMFFMGGIAAAFIAHELKGRITSAVNLSNQNQKISSLFGQQVSREVMDNLIATPGDLAIQESEASIMFLDIRNFSSYAEGRNSREIIEFQNNIFSPLIKIIDTHHGIINQIMGDGFMASFSLPVKNQNHCYDALNAGLAILDEIEALSIRGVIPPTRVGIGLHVGPVTTGNIGNDIRRQYSISGNTVIIAARLEQMNKQFGTEFLISEDFYLRVQNQLEETPVNLGCTSIKGYDRKIEIYKIR